MAKTAAPEPRYPWPAALAYPPTRQSPDSDDFHGISIADPFRWLESSGAAEVADWTAAQNRQTTEILGNCPDRAGIARRLRQLWTHRRTSLPVIAGVWSFHLAAEGLQNQPVLYVASDADEQARPLVDPNSLASDGSVALTGWSPSTDGSHLAYALSRHGTDRQEIRIRHTASGADLDEVLWFSKSEEDLPYSNLAWHPDGSGFYYPRLPDPDSVGALDEYRFCKVYWHRLGTAQSADQLVYARPDDPDLNFVPMVTGDGRYLVLHVWKGLSHLHQVCYRKLDSDGAFQNLFPAADARRLFLGSQGDQFFFHTNADAPRGRIIAVDLAGPDRALWKTIVPQGRETIDSAAYSGQRFIVTYICGSHHEVAVFESSGSTGPAIALPGKGRVADTGFDARTGQLVVQYESILEPPVILRFDGRTGQPLAQAAPPGPLDPGAFVIHDDLVTTPDGTKLPITLVHRRDLRRTGQTPLLLYGYGGFNVNITPNYDASRLLWLQNGGIYAFVNLRGGGEFGEAWHIAGARAQKQTVFNDFVAAAEWLVDRRYTDNAHLAISGESNGGLLVAACMLQRPQLARAVVCSIPVTDMLRYPEFTIGAYWIPEYGDARAGAYQFTTLHAYSPLHNVPAGLTCPAILLTTGMQDDRVVPAHAMKFAAALQHRSASGSGPILLRVQSDVGHGLGKPAAKVLELDTDIFTFLFSACGLALKE